MKLLLNNLSSYKIQKLIINSLEQALYQAIVVIDGEERIVWENDKKVLLSRNLMQLRELFETFDIPETVLRHESPYDEMIGFPVNRGSSNRMEVQLGKNPYIISN